MRLYFIIGLMCAAAHVSVRYEHEQPIEPSYIQVLRLATAVCIWPLLLGGITGELAQQRDASS